MESKPPQFGSLKTYLEPGEVVRLIDAASNLRDKIIIRFLFRTGCRVSELCAIETSNIDFERRYVLINHLKRVPRLECLSCGKKIGRQSRFCPYCGNELNESKPKEIQRQRIILLDRETMSLIQEYLDKRETRDARLIPLTRQRINQVISEAAERAGLGGKILLNPETDTGLRHRISPHKLRDAFALHWLERADDPEAQKALQEQLGHTRFDTTARYLKLDLKRRETVYDRVFKDED